MSESTTENTENNPYQAPSSDLEVKQNVQLELHPPVSNPFGDGWRWLSEAFEIFKKSAGVWIAMFIVYLVLMIAGSLVPFSNLLLGFFGPIFSAGFMVACYQSDFHADAKFANMFAGFKQQTGNLMLLGLLYVIFTVLLFVILGLFVYITAGEDVLSVFTAMAFDEAEPDEILTLIPSLLLLIPVSLLIWTPLIMAYWFAPALVVLNKQNPWTALRLSFTGCLKNILPFFLYSIVLIVFAVLASIPVGLGWLVLGPVMIIAIYTAYKAIFLTQS